MLSDSIIHDFQKIYDRISYKHLMSAAAAFHKAAFGKERKMLGNPARAAISRELDVTEVCVGDVFKME